jgi:phosphoglycolate phosphatase-like HAD superfamily hydrolase
MNIIFDIDNTIADCKHRLHYIEQKPKDWNKFFKACENDNVIYPMYRLYQHLEPSNIMILVTGRRENEREITEDWLAENGFEYTSLYMRKSNDFRPDYVVKSEILDHLLNTLKTIHLAVDDSPEVIKMYRSRGIYTLDANQGDKV